MELEILRQMKKVGVVTFSHSQENYGQILQGFALVNFLKSIGTDAFLIRVKHDDVDGRSCFQKIFDKLKLLVNPFRLQKIYKESTEQKRLDRELQRTILQYPRYFERFIKENIPSTNIWYDDNSIVLNPPYADAYVCGSDQIWGGDIPFMYLQFADKDKIRLSYAASFGGMIPSKFVQCKIQKYLSNFHWITVREKFGQDLCHQIGIKDVEVVPDPTLLLDEYVYKNLITSETLLYKDDPYIFVYMLGNKVSLDINEIFDFAHENSLKIKYVTAHGRVDDKIKSYPTIEEWLSLIINSSYVITNSYHGTIFSMIFHKKFITIPLVGIRARMNTRLEELLSRYELKSRVYESTLTSLFEDIDYTIFDEKIIIERKYINNKLRKILV